MTCLSCLLNKLYGRTFHARGVVNLNQHHPNLDINVISIRYRNLLAGQLGVVSGNH